MYIDDFQTKHSVFETTGRQTWARENLPPGALPTMEKGAMEAGMYLDEGITIALQVAKLDK